MAKASRNYNIEALRCLLMFLIVLHHAFIRGTWSYVPKMWTLPFLCLIAWHVPAFIAISGWFSVRFSWRKFMGLVGLMTFYSIPCWLSGDWRVSGGWFGSAYLALMLMSPFINAGIDSIVEGSRRGGWIAWTLFAIVMIMNWIPGGKFLPLALKGTDQFSLINMIFIYVTARIVRLTVKEPIRKRIIMLGPLIFIGTICTIGGLKTLLSRARGIPLNPADWTWLTYYNAPHVWIMAIAVLLYFVWHVHLPDKIGKSFTFVAPSMFSVYLLHEGCTYGQCVFKPIQETIVSWIGCHPAVSIALSAVVVFLFCIVVDLARRGVMHAVSRLMGLLKF